MHLSTAQSDPILDSELPPAANSVHNVLLPSEVLSRGAGLVTDWRNGYQAKIQECFLQTSKAVRRAGDDLGDDCSNSITTSAEILTDHQVYSKTSRINVWEMRSVPSSALTLASHISYARGLVDPTRIRSVCYILHQMWQSKVWVKSLGCLRASLALRRNQDSSWEF